MTEQQPAIDPLRCVFVPIERNGSFRTMDGERYRRNPQTSVIRRATPKVRGKAARKADKRARRGAPAISEKSYTPGHATPSMGGRG